MGQVEAIKQTGGDKRKSRLSPEINEFLHMLKALESELDTKPVSR